MRGRDFGYWEFDEGSREKQYRDFWRASGGFLELERRSKEVTESSTGIFRYGPLWFFSYIFSHLSYFSCLFSMISSLLVGLSCFDDYWFNI